MTDLIATFTQRGDLAHLALFLWASSSSALAAFALKELAAASRRFDDFVRELARFNENFLAPAPQSSRRHAHLQGPSDYSSSIASHQERLRRDARGRAGCAAP
jgi:hypothetical protein